MTKKTLVITVQGIDIAVASIKDEDYISLTDMANFKDNDAFSIIGHWMRNRNTLEYLGVWETLHNPNFKPTEFDRFKKEAGLNSFTMSPKKWIENTSAIGIISKSGRYGGTYAHKDIAFNFGMWLSPAFQLYIVQEYQHLKEIESNQYNLEWNVKRVLSKANYSVHTDAIKKYIIPTLAEWEKADFAYASEADLLNVVMFGCTAKQWREANPLRVEEGENIRDMASINELAILSNLETLNSELIKQGKSQQERMLILSETARSQKEILDNYDFIKSVKKLDKTTLPDAEKKLNE